MLWEWKVQGASCRKIISECHRRPSISRVSSRYVHGFCRFCMFLYVLFFPLQSRRTIKTEMATTGVSDAEDTSPSASSSVAQMKRRLKQPGAKRNATNSHRK